MSPFLEDQRVSGNTNTESRDGSVPRALQKLQQRSNATVKKPLLLHTPSHEVHDLICIGFGPASLAIAIALNDALADTDGVRGEQPKVCFLEKQQQFAWHSGMLLPGSKMQISFIKDLATLRNPRSEFTFLNYLKLHDRLVQFSNLGTFLPSRLEFEDYLRWCANHFTDVVEYGQDVSEILPKQVTGATSEIDCFSIRSRNVKDGNVTTRTARNVAIAVGGIPQIPTPFPADESRVIHSSQYCIRVPVLLPDQGRPYNIAVVGSGQSAAEIFHDLHQRYPEAKTSLIIRDTALRPSDDSPFVNEVFDPIRVDGFYNGHLDARVKALKVDKSTNYSVVRLGLLEKIYETLYEQRIKQPDESRWQHRVLPSREVIKVSSGRGKDSEKLSLTTKSTSPFQNPAGPKPLQETLEVDAVILATGYVRSAHEELLRSLHHLRPPSHNGWRVRRNYQVEMDESKVSGRAGIWLQGCNETTHGLSDTLLSTLATRSGEVVESIFGI